MIKASDIGLFEPIYTYVDLDGKNYNIASKRLDEWEELKSIEEVMVPVEARIAKQFIKEKSISIDRLARLTQWMLQGNTPPPVIFGQLDDGHMLISGHHRYFLSASLKVPFIAARILQRPQWEQFKVEGLLDISRGTTEKYASHLINSTCGP